MNESNETLNALLVAADGLLVMSESDYPFAPFVWHESTAPTAATLLAALGLDSSVPLETITLERLFASQERISADMGRDEIDRAQRFTALRQEIAARLRDIVVYRVGSIDIAVYIVGKDAQAVVVGLQTRLIET
jgi:hypothetical protein